MSAMAHHTVIARAVDAEDVTVPGTAQVFDHYCTLDEIGRRSVAIEVRKRFPGARRVTVVLSVGQFVADVYQADRGPSGGAS